jgi:quinolinate synthase
VLGTEAGMVTSIVRRVSELLSRPPHQDVEVEIVFPVAAEASTVTGEAGLPVVPGVAGGEGCTVAGGCATCPYMKMNDLDALLAVLGEPDAAALRRFEPRAYDETIDGRTIAELGGKPIIHMRSFQATGRMPESLLAELRAHPGRR